MRTGVYLFLLFLLYVMNSVLLMQELPATHAAFYNVTLVQFLSMLQEIFIASKSCMTVLTFHLSKTKKTHG